MNTRICPSPTGYFHVGTARTAYHCYLVAKATGGKFILRIDDTDESRNRPEYVDYIFDVFKWLDLKYDELYYQSKRTDEYEKAAQYLIDNKYAIINPDHSVSLNFSDFPLTWTDTLVGEQKIARSDIYIKRSNGGFLYNFCSIVDDLSLGVDWIIRGNDHLTNTSVQVSIAKALDGLYPLGGIKFTHLGLIHHNVLDESGKLKNIKMSKRTGGKSVLEFKDAGYNRDAFLHYIFKLGWSSKDPEFDSKHKTLSVDECTKIILGGNFQSSKSTFDVDKLNSLNRKYKAKYELL